uniref:NAD-dependent epimerase/dehydratase domain-containing protein n=1 Tax=Ditylum brightwellii TaxID=49249 RepID=A0A7S4WAK4_9STRA
MQALIFIFSLIILHLPFVSSYQVAVFGGNGFIGSRVCKVLSNIPGCSVISISRSGVPPSWCRDEVWANKVKWVAADAACININDEDDVKKMIGTSHINAAVSCVGNVRPSPTWDGFWGLHWDDQVMRNENGDVNVNIAKLCKSLKCQKFVYVSVSYDTAKALEGPLAGYLDGKRDAEEAAYQLFANDAIVFGPSLVYGGGRFASLGRILETILDSPIAKLYQSSNNALRGLSSSYEEDWVTNMAMTPPTHVDVISRAIAAAAVGSLDVQTIQPRRQGFFNTEGKPIDMVPVPFVDVGDLKMVAEQCGNDESLSVPISSSATAYNNQGEEEEGRQVLSGTPWKNEERDNLPLEGALVGYKPLLYPFPVAAFFITLFQWATNIEYPISNPVE